MSETVQKLAETLQGALTLLREAAYAPAAQGEPDGEHGTLLQQCLAMCEQQQLRQQPEPVRTVHHFACTGGTLICKCIAAMPNVQLLSEVDPLSTGQFNPGKPRFAPTDMVTLMRQSSRGVDPSLLVELFRSELRVVHAEATRLGQRLVLRDHAHSHFCSGPAIAERPNFRALVAEGLPLRSVVTVRHPLDSFASLTDKQWVQFTPGDIDEYSRRYLEFMRQYADLPVLRYEEFVADPDGAMQRLCRWLDLPYSPDFADLYSVFKLTGDSGRKGDVISPRASRAVARQLQEQALASSRYLRLVSELGYPARLDEAAA